jgi:hypothetical protein
VAKVRYRANTQDAMDVRVFFRTFNTMVSDLSYTSNTSADMQNYRRTPDGTTPLLGLNAFFSGAGNQIVSIPYFAERRVDTSIYSMATQSDATNKQPLVHAGAQEALQYFGCWLDFNQTEPQFPGNVPSGDEGPFTGRIPIVQFIRGIHQCLVAEVRFQPGAVDPITNGATPASSDRLSQRNLAILESDNPGVEATHVVQHTLLLKPSKLSRGRELRAGAAVTPDADPWSYYDELVIRWHNLPRATVANFYFPDWNADEVLALAASLHPNPQILTKVDAHTISCAVRDITYIPIPGRIQSAIPGLMTLQLLLSVRDGEQFRVDVQQHSGLTYEARLPERGPSGRGPSELSASRRKVLSAFRLTIAVKIGEPLLRKLVRNLAVLRYIFQAIPKTDSWHPVFVRYLAQLADQIAGLGVDPSQIPPSPDDPGLPCDRKPGEGDCYSGKVCEVIFDCFGDFDGFVLESCECRRCFKSTEAGIARLVLRACQERLRITVCLAKECKETIRKIIVHAS